MRRLTNYKILPELKLILECCKGKAQVIDAIDLKKEELLDRDFDPNYNVIVDFREFEIQFKSDVENKIIDFVEFLKGTKTQCRVSLLTDKPNQAVLSQLLKEFGSALPINFEIFSTLDGAVLFVKQTMNQFDLINTALEELNRNTAHE
jgi:hypothetical protein